MNKEKDEKDKKKKQVLIEDGTLSAFGFNNAVEIEVVPDKK
jgi:hypothetical protein